MTNIGTFVQDVGISSLIIRHNSLKRDVVRAIASVTTLKTLDLQHTIVKGDYPVACTSLVLVVLVIRGAQRIRFADLGDISALRSLTELNLQSVPYISKIEDLSRLSVLTALVTLHIGHSDVERSLLHEFRYFFPYLIELDMCYSRLLTHSGARFRFSSFPHLVSLTLDGYADMRDLTPLENLGHFKSFAFRDCNLQNDWLTSFRFTTKLEHLAISRNASLSDEGICHLSVLRSLRTLECNQLENVTTNGITRLLPDLPRLVSLYLAGSGSNEVYEVSLVPYVRKGLFIVF